jgi:hypothetical protein
MEHRLNTGRTEGIRGQLMKTHAAKGQTNQNAVSRTSPEWKILINCLYEMRVVEGTSKLLQCEL